MNRTFIESLTFNVVVCTTNTTSYDTTTTTAAAAIATIVVAIDLILCDTIIMFIAKALLTFATIGI